MREKAHSATAKNNSQNVIVILGLWICVATVAIIFIFNISARRKTNLEQKSASIGQLETKNNESHYNYARFTHTGYTSNV
jgi:hypothetical protein